MSARDYGPGFYAKWFLGPIIGGQLVVLFANILYCFVSLGAAVKHALHNPQHWDMDAFYPIRSILVTLLNFALISAFVTSLIEFLKLVRHQLSPGKLLATEISKVPTWILWANVATLSFFNIIDKQDLSFGVFALAIHVCGFVSLFLPIPYAAFLYVRERRGYYMQQDDSGWRYENGNWVPPEQPSGEEDNGTTTADDDTEGAEEQKADAAAEPEDGDNEARLKQHGRLATVGKPILKPSAAHQPSATQ